MHEGLVPYGLTKYAVDYFTKGLARELQATPLIIGSIRPGMLATEMVTSQYRGRPEAWKRARRIFNIIANSPEEVAPKLARRILENQRTGTCITTMRPGALLWRFVVSPFRRRDLFPADLD
jgi:NAD(P)-dependent dehydrogenase (short-subunit alcohol dehydrogenase family)